MSERHIAGTHDGLGTGVGAVTQDIPAPAVAATAGGLRPERQDVAEGGVSFAANSATGVVGAGGGLPPPPRPLRKKSVSFTEEDTFQVKNTRVVYASRVLSTRKFFVESPPLKYT